MKKKSLHGFIKYNNQKKITLACYFLTLVYRIQILCVPSEKLQKHWGERGKESAPTESKEVYDYAYYIGRMVDRVASKTDWESKCLVRALTARKLLLRKGIANTLYLGVGKDENGKMIAHAWLRCGEKYVTGGNGADYAMVAKFASNPPNN